MMHSFGDAMIVVVDDDAATCQSLERLLRSYGFRVETYTSASAFAVSGHLKETACLLLDVQMPGHTGLELQDYLRSEGLCVPIIFMTGHIDDEIRERAIKGGAMDMLEKPFDNDLLIDKIKSALTLLSK